MRPVWRGPAMVAAWLFSTTLAMQTDQANPNTAGSTSTTAVTHAAMTTRYEVCQRSRVTTGVRWPSIRTMITAVTTRSTKQH